MNDVLGILIWGHQTVRAARYIALFRTSIAMGTPIFSAIPSVHSPALLRYCRTAGPSLFVAAVNQR